MKTIGSIIFLTAAAALLLAGCSKDKPTKPTTYTVTVTSTDGGTAHAEPTEAVEGATITLTAAPNDGYNFEKWTVIAGEVTLEGEQADLVITFTMPAENVEIMAEFLEDIDVFTKITDDVLLEYCRAFDTNGDGKLSREEAQEVTKISVSYKGVTSLAGIEYFPSLEYLGCSSNSFTSLDVSKLPALATLICSNCQLNTLDISKNTELATLTCSSNQLTTLNLTSNTKLTTIDCSTNNLTSLDISKNTSLIWFRCYANQLSVLDATSMTLDDDDTYLLYCGMQKTASGKSQTLTLTLKDDMKEYWNTTLKGTSHNTSVVLAN